MKFMSSIAARIMKTVDKTLDRDHFMTASEAKEWGLVDRVVENRNSLAPEDKKDKDKG